jgi:hypothetical protein
MSIIQTYEEPIDIYVKLVREGQRLWTSNNIDDKSDHLFNFCVTSLSLRDWCIKHLKLTGKQRSDFLDYHSADKYLKYCGDIANMSKHLTLDAGRATNICSLQSVQTEIARMLPDGAFMPDVITRPSFSILDVDGSETDLFLFLFQVLSSWEKIFKKYKLPYFQEHFKTCVFIENGIVRRNDRA